MVLCLTGETAQPGDRAKIVAFPRQGAARLLVSSFTISQKTKRIGIRILQVHMRIDFRGWHRTADIAMHAHEASGLCSGDEV